MFYGLNEGDNYNADPVDRKNAELEDKLLTWIAKLLDLPACFRKENGACQVLYASAGDAFLNAALAAKNKKQMEHAPKCIADKQIGYASRVSNTAVERSIVFANLTLRHVYASDESKIVDDFEITTEGLEQLFQKDVDDGLVPTLFILTIGSTASLSIESVKDISAACEKYGVWLHIDSAHLGVYACVPEHKYILNDIELVDSFTTNGHKALGCGQGTSFFWTKHSDFHKLLTYKSDPTEDGDRYSLEDRSSFHLTPPSSNRALRAVTMLLSLGKKGVVEMFRMHFDLADYFRDLMKTDDRFEVLETKNNLPIVPFRLKGLSNEQQYEYYNTVMKSNKIYIGMSIVHNIAFIRMRTGSHTHDESHIREVFEHFKATADEYLS